MITSMSNGQMKLVQQLIKKRKPVKNLVFLSLKE